MGSNVACIRSDHGTEIDNAKLDEFCVENGITHNFSTPRTPQQNVVVERKNMTLEDMARTILIDSGIAKTFWAEAVNTACEVIDMESRKADMMSHVKESSEDDATTSPSIGEEPGPTITTTEAANRVVDAVQGTPLVEIRSGQEPQSDIPGFSTNEAQVPNWKHKISHPLDNIIILLDSGIQTMSKTRNSLAFSVFLSQIEPKDIKEALKDVDWITAMQDELHQFERNKFTLLQMDVKSAFSNGFLKEEFYVKQPPRFENHKHPERAFKLDEHCMG
nr:uncharacterized protein LOC117278600 [Nicotiana tomentosiformis]